MAQYQARTGPIINDAAPFVPSMVQADRPSVPFRFSSRNGQGWSVSQTTHVSAPFVSAMVEASRPSTSRAWIAPKLGQPPSILDTINVIVPFSIEMTYASRPVAQEMPPVGHPGWSVSPPEVTRFVDEPLFGKRPDVSRAGRLQRMGPSFFPWSGTPAPFGPEMVSGFHPDGARLWLPLRTGWSQRDATQAVFSSDMVAGWKPDAPRVKLGPRIPLPWSQTTPVAAPFSPEMSAGSKPDTNRAWLPLRTGFRWSPPDVAIFSMEMVQGSVSGKPRIMLGPRIPLPVSQPTHTSAPFSVEMIAGVTMHRYRYRAPRGHVIGMMPTSLTGATFADTGYTVHVTGLDAYLSAGVGLDAYASLATGLDVYVNPTTGLVVYVSVDTGLDDVR